MMTTIDSSPLVEPLENFDLAEILLKPIKTFILIHKPLRVEHKK